MNHIYYVGRTSQKERNTQQSSRGASARKLEQRQWQRSAKSSDRDATKHVIQFLWDSKQDIPCSSIDRNTTIRFKKVRQPIQQRILNKKQDPNRSKSHRKCESRTIHKQQQQPKDDEVPKLQSSLSLGGTYSVQPSRKIFFCQQCLAYLPIIEIKSHFAHCQVPKHYQQYHIRWQQITQLLQQVYQRQSNNKMYKLTTLMSAYAQGPHKENTYSLYSDELQRILAYKGMIVTSQLQKEQLFWVIEKIGDKLENITQSVPFWCK